MGKIVYHPPNGGRVELTAEDLPLLLTALGHQEIVPQGQRDGQQPRGNNGIPPEKEGNDHMAGHDHQAAPTVEPQRTNTHDLMAKLARMLRHLSPHQHRILAAIQQGKISRPTLEERFPGKPLLASGIDALQRKIRAAGIEYEQVIRKGHVGQGRNRTYFFGPGPLLASFERLKPPAPKRGRISVQDTQASLSKKTKALPAQPKRAKERWEVLWRSLGDAFKTALTHIKGHPGIALDQLTLDLRLSTIHSTTGLLGRLAAYLNKRSILPDDVFRIHYDGGRRSRHRVIRYYPGPLLEAVHA
ncbi:MAG: hypothetical protein HY369_02820 [Candidatus Aenigmarchaeota archaeon]|nr:hypothetical protein [Candidatus Aenigmarchaeota archaeon]